MSHPFLDIDFKVTYHKIIKKIIQGGLYDRIIISSKKGLEKASFRTLPDALHGFLGG
jgi:hypothetical protein